MQDLGLGPASSALGVSADGSVVVGVNNVDGLSGNSRAFRWTAAGGMQDLGVLPGGYESIARSVSADGSVVVGEFYVDSSYGESRAFRWTAAGGMQELSTLPGLTSSEASGVSADGLVVVGRSNSDIESPAVRWAPCFHCRADFNGVGGLSVQDIFDFLAAYFAGDIARANFNNDCCISVQDIFDFLAAYFAGCT
jgi:probable HAF family extracellular repeat protein